MSARVPRRAKGWRTVPDAYLRLIHEHPLRPIRSATEYDSAARVSERLALRGERNLSAGERDYLDALDSFIAAYDDEHFNLEERPGTPLARLKFLIEQSGGNVNRLGAIIGSQPLASMILSGRRDLSKAVIAKLARHFKVDPGYFF